MKTWFVFGGKSHYPAGGMDDFLESFETENEANEFLEKNENLYVWMEVKNILKFL